MIIDFDLKSPTALTPNKKVSLSFETLKPDTDFSSLAVKVLDVTFFQQRCFIHVKNLFCVTTFINDRS